MLFSEALEICPGLTAVMGSGGKTSLVCRLADELSAADFADCRAAGLTAGASTPAGIIKEVKTTMSEEIKSTEGMEESFEELLNQSFKTLNTGEKVTGIVTAITPTPAGEGKTTTTVGLADGLRKLGKKSVVALREPSLGPVFGLKGCLLYTSDAADD